MEIPYLNHSRKSTCTSCSPQKIAARFSTTRRFATRLTIFLAAHATTLVARFCEWAEYRITFTFFADLAARFRWQTW